MKLSPHFSLEELIHSDTATRLDIDNTPSEEVMDNLKFLAEKLEDVRALLHNPMLISSGYRSYALNDHLGSKRTSAHTRGLAVDFISPSFGTPEEIVEAIVNSDIEYDQVILEFGRWVHLAFTPDEPRKQALIIDKKGTRFYPDN
jgi:zinc D-Ala-D-Ala carboxypeptidase